MTPAKHIVITGTSRGLGRALVQPLIDRGHTISGCGRSASAAAALNQIYAAPHRFAGVDVGAGQQVEAWAQRVLDANGSPDLILNIAGVINRSAPFWEIGEDDFNALVRTNVSGSANVLRSFLPAMIEAGRGVMVNFSSGWGRHGAADVVPYCTSKFAVEGLSQALADEVPPGLAVVSLNPGVINTEMLKSVWGEAARRCPSPETWARSAVELLLNLSADDNGKQLSIHF
jgi:NAD(P)-dependent dehydrogenase (short-subunit alcohol dehydrogenase family)